MWYLNTETAALINLNEIESIETFPLCSKGGGCEIVGCSKTGEQHLLHCITPQNDSEWDEIKKELSYKTRATIFLNALQNLMELRKACATVGTEIDLETLSEKTVLKFIKESIDKRNIMDTLIQK